MHAIVRNELENHFAGDAPRSFYDHLDACSECRAEVSVMEEFCRALRELKSETLGAPEPPAGFYLRVERGIIDRQKNEAWGLFSPGAAFFRRIAFASLLVLASLGSFLVTHESSADGADAASIMAQQDSSAAHSDVADRDRILVTLASYGE